jgi:hypothetical protein
MKFVAASMIALFGLVLCLGTPRAGDNKEPKYTIKDVMKKAHKDGLLKKILSGKAEDDERKELLVLYVALSQNKPPRGDADDWKERTGNIVKAAKAAQADAKAGKGLAKVTNCAACHKLHK